MKTLDEFIKENRDGGKQFIFIVNGALITAERIKDKKIFTEFHTLLTKVYVVNGEDVQHAVFINKFYDDEIHIEIVEQFWHRETMFNSFGPQFKMPSKNWYIQINNVEKMIDALKQMDHSENIAFHLKELKNEKPN